MKEGQSDYVSEEESRFFYTLRFSYRFKFENDKVYFAAGYPYTFS